MSISYSNTIKDFKTENFDEQKEPEKVKGTGKISKMMKIIIISAIVLAVISGIIILIVVFTKDNNSDNKRKYIPNPDENTTSTQNVTMETDNVDDSTYVEEPIIGTDSIEESENINNSTDNIYVKPKETNISYNEGQLRFYNIEKNISSEILGESNRTQENDTFNYISVLGIKNEKKEEYTNKSYYEGFFAILCSSYFNKTKKKEEPQLYNIELSKIINNSLINNFEKKYIKKENIEDNGNTKPFLKISFYNDGTYKNIKQPYNLSEENYKEMKDILDLIIPKIGNDRKFVEKINQETIEKEREIIQKNNSVNDYNNIKIFRKDDEKNIPIEDKNSNNSYYINGDHSFFSDMNETKEEKSIINLNCIENDTYLAKLNIYENSGIYSNITRFRGSNRTINSSTYIDKNHGFVKEIFSRKYMDLSKQNCAIQTDKNVYNEVNSIKENDVINEQNEANITDQYEETNNKTNNNAQYDLNQTIFVVISHHIFINESYYDEKAIDNIYNRYLNNFTYEENNSNKSMLNRLRRVLSLKDLDEYEIIEGNNIRNLQEYELESFYGLKKISHRKDIFKTNFLGLDIAFGLVNTYYPSLGQSNFNLKFDIGDFHISKNIESFKTNQPIIIENIQQMSYKLLKMMYSTHINLEKQNKINYNKINPIFENLLDILNITNETNNSFPIQNLYLIFSQNKEKYQIYIDDLLNNSIIVNNNLTDLITPFNSTRNILENYLNYFINNVIKEINIKLDNIEKTILDLNEEIKKNKDIVFYLYLYEDYRSLIEKIKRYINYGLNKYIEKELNKGEIIFISEKDNYINEIMNLNKIYIIMDSIENKIFNYIFSNEEQNLFSSYLKDFKNIIETNNVSSSFDTLTYIFQKQKIQNTIISNISNISNLLDEADDHLEKMKENLSEYNDIEEYYNQINKLEETINDIITLYIKNYSVNLFNKYTYAYESINNITKNLQEKVFDFGKKVKNYLFEIKNEKKLNEINLEDTYLEKNMFDLYNLTNKRIDFFLKENSENYTSFDKIFIESMNNSIIKWTKYYIDKNFQLAYDYLNEAKYYVNNCKETKFLFFKINCDYYLNPKLIKTLENMSTQSIQIVKNIDTDDFLNAIEDYYYFLEKELSQNKLKINETICINNKGFSYLYNLSEESFDFTNIKSNIKNITQYLYQYSKDKQEYFLKDFSNFTNNKKGTFSLFNYDVYLGTDAFDCKNRNNYKYLYINSSLIKAHLKNDKESIINNYLEEKKDIEAFLKDYCKNLISSIKGNSNENKYKIHLYIMLEKYKADIINILESFTNYEFIKAIFDEYQNYFYNISLTNNDEYLNDLIYNLSKIYSNTPYLIGNEEIQKIDEDINLLKNWEDYKKDSDARFNSSIELILDNKIRMVIILNDKIFKYIISDLNNDENLKEEIGIVELNFKEINKIINKYQNFYQNNLEKISNLTKNESFDSFDLYNDIKNFSYILDNFYNDTENNNTIQNKLLLKYLKEIKIKREIEGIERLISNNEYNIDIDKNSIPKLNIDNVKLLYEQIRFNISNEAKNIIRNDIKQDTNNLIYNYSLEIFNKIEKIYKDNYKNNRTLFIFKELISEINYDFIEEVEKDLNISYTKLFDLIGKYIILNNKNSNNDFKYINKKYYNEILSYLNLTLDNNNINNISRNYDEEKEKMKDIIFISIKRLEEKKIRYIKSYLNNNLKKYDSFHNETNIDSIISIIYEENKIGELYPLYLEIFKELSSINFELPDMDRNKTSFEKIKNITLNLYEKNFNIFNENFIYENINYYYNGNLNNSLLNLIEEEIENILNEIKNIIKNSIEETQNLSLDGYYLKRHIINNFANKIDLDIPEDFNSIGDFINDNNFIMEYLKIKEEKIYEEKISNKLTEVFNYTLKDYYYNYECYELEVSRKIILMYDNYFYSMLSYSDKLIKNKFKYLHFIIDEKKEYGNSTYEKIKNLSDKLLNIILKQIEENLDTFYSEASFMKNKNILIKASKNTIFNDTYMNEILLTNNSKNSFIYNDIINNIFKNCIDNIIHYGSKFFVKFNHENRYNDLKTYWSENIIPISIKLNVPSTNFFISLIEDLLSENKNDFEYIDKLLKILENQFNNLNINAKFNMNNDTVKLIMLDIEKKYKINGIDIIINKYEKFMEAVIENNITNKLNYSLTNNLTNYFNSSIEFINDVNNVINNYSISLLDEIKNYCYKLKVFAMIDGLNHIPIEKAKKLGFLWDYSNNSYSKILKNSTSTKLLTTNKINDYLKNLDKKGKKDILINIEKIFNNNSSLNLQDEYNTNEFFNSKSEPLTINSILEMIENLNNDVNNFNNMIKNNDYFNKIKLNYELLKKHFVDEDYNNKIVKLELSFISSINSNIYIDYLDYLESIEIESKPEKEAEKQRRKEIIDFIENYKRLNDLNELSNKIILSIYNIYLDTINKQSKIINIIDNRINFYFENYIDNVDTLLKIVNNYKIFSEVKDNIENIEYDLIIEIDDKIEKFSKFEEFYDELENRDHFINIYNYHIYEEYCYSLNVIDKIPLFPIIIPCPDFPPLQIRLSPIVNVTICSKIMFSITDKELLLTNVVFDFSTKASFGLNLEGGIYLDIYAAKLTASVGVNGTLFEGKVGVKISIDFDKSQLQLQVYLECGINLYFKFYILIQAKLLKWEKNIYKWEQKEKVQIVPYTMLFKKELEMLQNFTNDEINNYL